MCLHAPDWKTRTHSRGAVIKWRQFNGLLQFLSSLSRSTTGTQSSSSTSRGVLYPNNGRNITMRDLNRPYPSALFTRFGQTFTTLRSLQVHDFLRHFLLSTGFNELIRISLVDSEYGSSGLYSESAAQTCDYWWGNVQKTISGLSCCILTVVLLDRSSCQAWNVFIRWVWWAELCLKEKQTHQ